MGDGGGALVESIVAELSYMFWAVVVPNVMISHISEEYEEFKLPLISAVGSRETRLLRGEHYRIT